MKAGLLGRKLGHSLSPQIHRLFGDYEYRLYEQEPDEVAAFLRKTLVAPVGEDAPRIAPPSELASLGGYDGTEGLGFLNVTIPYKQTVFALCDELSPIARKLGNVNFVTRTEGGRLRGDNTDAFGVERLLDSVGADVRGRNCAILGAGGAAMTVKAVLEERGARRVAFVRRGEEPGQDDEIIVNATPVGMWPHADDVRVNIAEFPNCEVVLDLVYNPSPTRLVREARACGKTAADGMVMLVAQAYKAGLEGLGGLGGLEGLGGSNLFLYGPPASGKSTWAKRIAEATGWALVDLDAEIVKVVGRSIPEIFSAEGERGFRTIENNCLRKVCAGCASAPQVVALGGGALLDGDCRQLAEASGRVVVLDCDLETLKSRLTGGDRPLSADVAKLEALLAARAAHYASFPRHVQMCRH